MIIYKICLTCNAEVDPCHEVCPLCGGVLVGIDSAMSKKENGDEKKNIPSS
jgi:rRNA maturation endonuclease Nob1